MSDAPVSSRTNGRKAALIAIGFATTFLAGDQVLSRIDWPRIVGSRNGARWQWDLFDRSVPTPDVVFVGCSYSWFAVDPTVVDAEVARISGRKVASLNLSSTSASTLTEYLLVRRIVESGRLPKVAYLGVSPAAMTAVRRGWIRNGLLALGDVRDLPLAASVDAGLFWDTLRTSAFKSYHRWEDSRVCVGRLAIGAPVQPESRMKDGGRGWVWWDGGPAELPGQPTPEQWPEARRTFLAGLTPDSVNVIALHWAIEMLESAGVVVRLLEPPFSSNAVPWERHAENKIYQELITEASTRHSVPLVQPPQGLVDDDDFFDPVHVYVSGAKKVSRWLATDVAEAMACVEDAARDQTLATARSEPHAPGATP